MKWFFSFSFGLSVLLFILTGCQSIQSESMVDSDGEWVFEWDNLESRIIELTNQGLRDENPSELYHLKSLVENVRTSEDGPLTLSGAYWLSVLNTNLVLVEQERGGEPTQVLHLLDESIELLEHTEFSVVEKNALLAMLYRAKIEYDPSRTFELFSKMQDTLDVAIEADSTNLRVLLAQVFIGVQPVLGFSIDLDVQKSIDTALNSTFKTQGDSMTPTWGLSQIYALAISRLMEAEKITEASELAAEAIDKFPDDTLLNFWAQLFQIEAKTHDP